MNYCKCGCGKEASKGRNFLPGHDSKLRKKIEDKIGGIFGLEDLVNAAELFHRGKIREAEFNARVKELFDKKYK